MSRPRLACSVLLFVIGVGSALALFAQAQPAAKPSLDAQTISDLERLRNAAFASDYAYRQTEYLTDSIGPRGNGSPQQQAAVEYVADEMRRLGLEVRIEKVTIPHWQRGEERAELVAYPGQARGTTQKIVLTALGGSVATPPDGLTAEIVVVNNYAELQALGRDKVAGKIVVFNEHFDQKMAAEGFGLDAYGEAVEYRGGAPTAASRLGAVGTVIRSVGGAEFRLPHTGGTRYAKDVKPIPAAAAAAEDLDLMARLARRGPVKLHLLLTPQTLPDATTYNVIGDLKGTEHPEQVVIVSGHLDSWELGTGAIDDAAGVGVSLEAANLIKKLGLKPKRTIRVIAWAAEEIGIDGGIAYGKQHASEVGNHYAAIESDLGAGHPVGFYVNGDPALLPLLQPLSSVLRSSGAGLMRVAEETGADIIPLTLAGVPSFSPIQDARKYFDYHHTAADTLDKIDPHELQENAAVMVVLAYGLANMDAKLPRLQKPLPDWLK